MLGDAFHNRDLIDGEFSEFFLDPLHTSQIYRDATISLLRSFDFALVAQLRELHQQIHVPVGLVWGELDKFFPLNWAREMVGDFSNARLDVIKGAGLFSHEERPAEVASALLPTLVSVR